MSHELVCELIRRPECLQINGAMTVQWARALSSQWLPLLDDPQVPASLDLAGVTEIDAAGLQLLLVARRAARLRGRTLTIIAASPVVRTMFRLCRLELLEATLQSEAT